MGIRAKIILVVLPLIVVTLLLTGVSSFFSATNAITGIAKEFLGFKAGELEKYAANQWGLLVENNFTENPAMVAATQAAIEAYAASVVRSPTEVIFALDAQGGLVMKTGELEILPGEEQALRALVEGRKRELATPRIGGTARVAEGFWFEPFGWYLMVSEQRSAFYSRVNQIAERAGIILAASILLGVLLILGFAGYLTRPLTKVAGTMQKIITTGDLSSRVAVEYHDEIGRLAHTFNLMVGQLERNERTIKHTALKATLAKIREYKIRNIFQKYAPDEVINQYFKNPASLLHADNRMVSILFSDIRGFTSLSEGMPPDQLVDNLNRYFTIMVEAILKRNGYIDKYIGDAIMALWGAFDKDDDPKVIEEKHNKAVQHSVLAALDMIEALPTFNAELERQGKAPWRIGVGINYGYATVGNMGTEKKLNYSIIGDQVNLASRLEGLTKEYRQPVVLGESLFSKIKDKLPLRLLSKVAVKGKKAGVKIFTTRRALNDAEAEAWTVHNDGMERYFARDFRGAIDRFQKVQSILPEDYPSQRIMDFCRNFLKAPPPGGWDGVEVMEHK